MGEPIPEYFFGTTDPASNQAIYSSYAKEIEQLTTPFLKKNFKECRILDVGSGNGGVAIELASKASFVSGVEVVPALHEHALKRLKENSPSNIEYKLGSVYDLTYCEEYDLVVFLTAIEHIQHHHRAIEKIVDSLKPGGIFYLTAPNKLWPIEQHYNLPFLSWLPLKLANLYVRLTGKAESFEDASYSLTYFGMKKLLNQFPLEYEFVTPHSVDSEVYGCGTAKKKGLYRFAKWLLDRFPFLWVISKGFIIVARKKEYSPSLENKRIAVVTYTHKQEGKPSYLAGPSQDLKCYLKERAQEVFFVEQPISFSQDLTATAEQFVHGEKKNVFSFPMFPLSKKSKRPDIDQSPFVYLLFKIRDFFSTIYFFFRVRGKFDSIIAVESINALAGLVLRFLGKTKSVVYDVIDYSPVRFPNRYLNKIYHFLDNLCVRRSDFSWSQTQLVTEHRSEKGISPVTQLVKATGVDSRKIGTLPWEEIKKNQMIYVGGIYPRDGVELLIESLPYIKKEVPNCKLLVVGYGNLKDSVMSRSIELGVRENIDFLGAITDSEKVDQLIRESAVGLAPYTDDQNSLKAYNDTAKPKLYLTFGAPVVMTRTTRFSEELETEKAGFAVEFNVEQWAQAVIQLLGNQELLKTYRENAIALAKKYTWEVIFDRLFEPIEKRV